MSQLLGPAEVRAFAAELDVTPTKKLGQNFVHDANTVRKIVALAGVTAGDVVLEIGPGLGSLTLGLLEADATVLAVEIDGRLAAKLPDTAATFQPDGRLTVIHSDALEITELPATPTHVVANLPYNVSVPVLLHLLETFPSLRSALVMVQAEVGYRIAAEPGSKVYGVPSIKAAWWGNWSVAGSVSRQVFWPVPNVDSVLVRFEQREPLGDDELRRRVFALVDAAFGQRRKMLRQSLSAVFGDSAGATAALEAAGVSPEARGEALGLDDFVRLARLT